jgi:Haem-binding domain
MKARRTLLIVIGIVVGFIVLQIIPMGNFVPGLQFPGNPAVAQAIAWDSPQTEALLRRTCFDCHSNETTWPWYSRIAPMSWLVNKDVNEGRRELNFSELRSGRNPGRQVDEIGERVYRDMPPKIYTMIHPDAILTDAEKQALVDGVAKTFGAGA